MDNTEKPKSKILLYIFAIIGGIVIGGIVLFILLFSITSFSSKKLVCEAKEGKITLMFNDKTIKGFSANGFTYDLDGQKDYADLIGIDAYIDEFSLWFETNTSGSCSIK